jgi:4-hydroxybenzoate polyprenyltransferase
MDKVMRTNLSILQQVGSFAKTAWYLLESARVVSSSISLLLAVTIVYTHLDIGLGQVWLRCIPILLVTMTGFMVNDCVDVDKDRLNKVSRPVARGLLSVRTTLVIAIALMLFGISIDAMMGGARSAFLILCAFVAVTLYSFVSRLVPFVKAPYTACLCCIPVMYAGHIAGVRLPITIYMIVFAFIVGREVLLDLRDFEGDRSSGLRTLPSFIGEKLSAFIGWLMMLAAVMMLIQLSSDSSSRLFGWCSVLSLGISYYIYRSSSYWGLKATRFAMILALIPAAMLQ